MNASSDFLNALAWSLLHFLWQGAAIAAAAAGLFVWFKKPTTRYLVGIGALALMLMSFAVTYSVLRGSSVNGAELSLSLVPAPEAANSRVPDDSAPLYLPRVAAHGEFLWVARAWLVGVFGLALRIAFGLLVLEQLRRRGLIALPESLVARFRALQARVGIRRVIQYCECQAVRVPAVIGLFRPVVLIPMRALTGLTPEQLEAVVAHELGHIKRFDVAVNFVQTIAETLLFFHPAVWWLNKRIRADREECCDDVAVGVSGGSVGYARALATMAGWRDAPTFAMAATGGPIAARVARLLGVREHASARSAGVFTASLVLLAALAAGGVSLGFAKPAQASPANDSSEPLMAQAAPPPAPPAPAARAVAAPEPVVSAEPAVPARPAAAPKPPRPAKPARNAIPAQPAQPAQPARPAAKGASYIDEMKAAGYDNLDVDELVAFKIQGVTPEYVREIRGVGFNPDANELVAMKIQGVTPEYVQRMRALNFKPDTQEIIAMRVQGVTPEYVQEIRAQGFTPDAQELIAMKIQGVTPEFRNELAAAGYKLDVSELIQARVMGITPDFVEKARAHGFKDLDIQKLIQLKNADVF